MGDEELGEYAKENDCILVATIKTTAAKLLVLNCFELMLALDFAEDCGDKFDLCCALLPAEDAANMGISAETAARIGAEIAMLIDEFGESQVGLPRNVEVDGNGICTSMAQLFNGAFDDDGRPPKAAAM